ncbi:MAG: hypothetical protein J5807_00925 [Kiritimatiellae bacterium]|nr:hypothetical protein [Kiritimatiellia bacterium]
MTKKLVMAVVAFAALSLFADTYTWTHQGGGSFSELSNWTLSSTGAAPTALPGNGDDVVLPNAEASYTVTSAQPFSIGSLTMGGGTGAGAPTLSFENGLSTNYVAGSVSMASGSVMTHPAQPGSATVLDYYRVCLVVGGSMTISSGAKIDTISKGFVAGKGPGAGGAKNKQASHGGLSSYAEDNALYTRCYGSIRVPVLPGSGLGNSGTGYYSGGAIYLVVAGTLENNGTITSSVTDYNNTSYNGCSPGSVYVKTGTLSGSGSILAKASKYGTAGGGRVAVRQTTARTWSAWSGIISASQYSTSGTQAKGSAGTVYLETAADDEGRGELHVEIYPGSAGVQGYHCAISTSVDDAEEPFGKVFIGRSAKLLVCPGSTLTVRDGLYCQGTLTAPDGSSVVLVPAANSTCVVSGDVSFASLQCRAPNAEVAFWEGCTVSILDGGSLDVAGAAGANVALKSTSEGHAWQLVVGEGAAISVANATVSDSDASSGAAISATDSVNAGGNSNWYFTGGVVVGETITWTGLSSDDWGDAGNWDLTRQPAGTDVVVIPAGSARYPVLTVDFTANVLTNSAGASITLGGGNLIVTNRFANFGDIAIAGGESLRFSGDGMMTADMGGRCYKKVVIDKQSGVVAFDGGFSVTGLFCRTASPLSLVFERGKTVEAQYISLCGLTAAGESAISLSSSVAGQQWGLKLTNGQHVRGVMVADCDATGGRTVVVGDLGSELVEGSNDGWDFTPGAAAEWTGAAGDTYWATAGNWLPAVVPQAGVQVCICPGAGTNATVIAKFQNFCGDLVLGGDDGSVTLTSRRELTAGGDVYLGSSSTAYFDYYQSPSVISNDLELAAGAVVKHTYTSNTSPTDTNGTYKCNLLVRGNVYIRAGGAVDLRSCGFVASRGYGSAAQGPSHGGVGSSGNFCIGSVLRPYCLGPSSQYNAGGGAIKLVCNGEIVVDGTINASTGQSTIGGLACGGSIWLEAARISGSGSLLARGYVASHATSYNVSSGGRIALYQTQQEGWDGLTATVDCCGYSCGTIYREDATGNGEVFIGGSRDPAGQVQLPMPMDGDARSVYARARVTVGESTALAVTNDIWNISDGPLVVRDLHLADQSAAVDCLGSTIRVKSYEHYRGTGWANGRYRECVQNGTVLLGEGGEIVWPAGMFIILR